MAIPLAVAAGLGLVSTGLGAAQYFQGAEGEREAEKASAKFAADIRQRLLERTVGKQALPMRGFDLAKEGLAQRYATGVSALQSAGAEGVLGGLGGLMQQQTEAERALAAQVEKMEYARDLEYQRRLDRERDLKYQTLTELDLMGLKGAQAKAADAFEGKREGIKTIFKGAGTAAELGLKYAPLYRKTGGATGSGDMIDIGGDTSQISRVGRPPIYSGLGPFQPGMNPMSQPLSQTYTGPFPLHSLGAVSTGLDSTPMGGQQISLGGGLAPSALTTPYYWNPWNPEE